MSKITLDSLASGYSLAKLNSNFQKIETELNTKVFYRANPDGEPNALQSNVDVNGKRVYNVPKPLSLSEVARLEDVIAATQGAKQAYQILADDQYGIDNALPARWSTVQTAINELDLYLRTGVPSLATLASSSGSSYVGFKPTATATTRTVESKLSDILNVKDFGAVADGTFVAGGVASGTDNLTAFNAAISAAIVLKVNRIKASGVFRLSAGLVLPRGITLEGDGTSHLPIFLGGTNIRGTALLINGSAGGDCLAFQENTGHAGLCDISVYNTSTAAIRAVVAVVGHLYPRMKNVEIASLRRVSGTSLFIAPSTTGALFETLWGDFDNVICTIDQVGLATEASVRYGLSLRGISSSSRPNANSFRAGQFAGTWAGLLADGAVANSGPLSCVFHGTKFDTIWDGTFSPKFLPLADGLFGYLKTNTYIYPVVQVVKGFNIAFHGCYIEAAGAPTTYNDGVNGSANLVAAAWVDSAAECIGTGFVDCNWNAAYLYDKGSRTLCTPTSDGHRHDTRLATNIAVRASGIQAIPSATWTKVSTPAIITGDDSHIEWDNTNGRVKIRSAGVYQISAQIEYAGWATAGTYATTRVTAGGYTFGGVTQGQLGAGTPITTQVQPPPVMLSSGETVTFETLHNQGASQSTSGVQNTFLSVTKIG